MCVNITLCTGKGDIAQCYLMAECVGYGVLDTACTKTVAGMNWMNEFVASLPVDEQTKVMKSERKTASSYRFGDGVETQSTKTVDIPILISGNKKTYIEVDVVMNKIPLLISNPTMKSLGFIINTRKGEIHVDGTSDSMKLGSTLSGHFKMPICHTTREDCNITFNVERLIGSTTAEKRQKAVKLHRQMCHASSEGYSVFYEIQDVTIRSF